MHPLPPPVERLLRAGDAVTREDAWAAFVAEYSRLILHVARAQTDSHDDAMDRYTHVLQQLRADDLRRLRMYQADGRGKFTTWLVVVVRRLCQDAARQRYGRHRGASEKHPERRELADLVGSGFDLDLLPDDGGLLPDDEMRARDMREALTVGLDQLETADRLLLRLRFQDDVAVAEIARIFSLPSVFHVYRWLNRVYAQLRATLQGLGIEDPNP
jgi:RNA polymerase sigma factor (sigma-70 family)